MPDRLADRFCEAFAAAWSGRAESDALSRLVLAAQLSWRQVVVVRALVRYLRQTGLPYSLPYVAAHALADVAFTRLLVRLFEVRFDPAPSRARGTRRAVDAALASEIRRALDAVQGLDADRILRALLSAVQAVLRTNAFQRGARRRGAAVPVRSSSTRPSVAGLPEPRPTYEIWVYSPRVEGVHLRFGAVARGGLRWSDRREDFRTEVLGLVKAQIVKNAVIVPTGAKGGFVAKQLPDPAADRDAWRAEGIACYRTFISGLLDVTDDLHADGAGSCRRPTSSATTATTPTSWSPPTRARPRSPTSPTRSPQARGFWLGDAFASGGSNGYDHKAMGITARGAWESVRRHFRELGVDADTTTDSPSSASATCAGDVFGNGMLLSRAHPAGGRLRPPPRLPRPRPRPGGVVRRARSACSPCPARPGPTTTRRCSAPAAGSTPARPSQCPSRPQVAARLGLPTGTTALSPSELVRAVLRAPVDLFWNGGIGTYVKASTETHAEVGDKANDAVRVDGAELRVRVVGEGGNLGLTQRGRIEARCAGRARSTPTRSTTPPASTAATTRSTSRSCSTASSPTGELGAGRAQRAPAADDRRRRPARAAQQRRAEPHAVGRDGAWPADLLPAHRRFLEVLEGAERSTARSRRCRRRPSSTGGCATATGSPTPSCRCCSPTPRSRCAARCSRATCPTSPGCARRCAPTSRHRARRGLRRPARRAPAAREIAATVLVNDVVAAGGLTFAFRAAEETGSDVADVVRAFAVTRHVFGLDERIAAVEALDGQVPATVQTQLRHEQQRLLDRAVRWFLQARPEGIDVAREIERFGPTLSCSAPRVHDLLLRPGPRPPCRRRSTTRRGGVGATRRGARSACCSSTRCST